MRVVLEVRDGSLLVYWAGEEIPPREPRDRLATAHRVLRLLAPADVPPDEQPTTHADDSRRRPAPTAPR